MRETKYPFNPAYYQAHNDISKRRDTKRLYFSPLRIDLPHGRGAGATSFCALEAILAVEKSVIENQKPQKPKKRLPYHVAEHNDTAKLRNVLVLVKTPSLMHSVKDYFMWAIDHLGLIDKYKYCHKNHSFFRKDTHNIINIVAIDYFVQHRIPIQPFNFIVIDDADTMSRQEFISLRNDVTILNQKQNGIILISYNPRFKDNWLGMEGDCYKGDVNYRRYHADYRSMPRDWLGESFFKQAKMLKEANPKAYSEEYLGLPYKEPKKKVLHGTFRGKQYMERKKRKGKTK